MKGIDDPEFLLLRKARELKKRMGSSDEIDELIEMAESIVKQNAYGAIAYTLSAVELTKMENDLNDVLDLIKKKRKKKSE